MKTVILAAGYAVRLRPLTLNMSKSLLAVGGRKIIDRILDKVAEIKGFHGRIYIVTNAKFLQNFNDWLKDAKYRDRISLVNDGTATNEARLGAIRDMEFVIRNEAISDDLLVIAGDNLFAFDLNAFLGFAKAKSDGVSVALHDIRSIDAARNFGVVKVDSDNRIVDFEEKPENPKSTLISTGIYYFPKDKVELIEKYVKIQDKLDAPGYYIRWLVETGKVYGFAFSEDWRDIGSLESYKRADKEYS